MRIRLFWLTLCLLCSAGASVAATFNDLYVVRQPIAQNSQEALAKARSQAFTALILRLTGDANALDAPALKALGSSAEAVQRAEVDATGKALMVEFDRQKVQTALDQANIARLGANRPAVLAWWLNQSLEQSQLIGGAQPGAQTLLNAAQYRGVVLRLPMADLEEQLSVDQALLAQQQASALAKVSARYAPQAILAVQVDQQDSPMRADWQLWLGDERFAGTAEAEQLSAVADQIMREVATTLVPKSAQGPGSASSFTLEFSGVDFARYSALDRLMESFSAQLLQSQGQQLSYRVTASAEQLREQLTALGWVEVLEAPSALIQDTGSETETETETETEAATQAPTASASDVLRFKAGAL